MIVFPVIVARQLPADYKRVQVPDQRATTQIEALLSSISSEQVERKSLARSVCCPAVHRRRSLAFQDIDARFR